MKMEKRFGDNICHCRICKKALACASVQVCVQVLTKEGLETFVL